MGVGLGKDSSLLDILLAFETTAQAVLLLGRLLFLPSTRAALLYAV